MASEWDSVNKKKVYRGKYSGDKREFKGSRLKEYSFKDPKTGTTRIIKSSSYNSALREAKSLGYSRNDYVKKSKKKKKK